MEPTVTNETRPDPFAARPLKTPAAAVLEALVAASAKRALRDYRAAPPADDSSWVRRAERRTECAVILDPAAAKPVVMLTCRVGKEPWRLGFRLGEVRLDVSTGTYDLDEARAVRATIEAEVAQGRIEPCSAARPETAAAVLTLLDILGPPFERQRRDPQPSGCTFDFDVAEPGMDDPHVRDG